MSNLKTLLKCRKSTFCVDDNQDANVSVYPNPATSFVKIEGENIKSAGIFSADGKEMRIVSVSGDETNTDISGLAPGIYVMKVTLEDKKVLEEKIVKK